MMRKIPREETLGEPLGRFYAQRRIDGLSAVDCKTRSLSRAMLWVGEESVFRSNLEVRKGTLSPAWFESSINQPDI